MTKHVPNHPEERILDHPEEETKGIRGRSSQKKKWLRPHAFYYAQGKCNRGEKCYYKHGDKAAAATKESQKRTNLPARKKDKKGKDSNAAPCLIDRCQKFACMAKTKPNATSSQVDSEPVSMKRIRFRKSVHFIEVSSALSAIGQESTPVCTELPKRSLFHQRLNNMKHKCVHVSCKRL